MSLTVIHQPDYAPYLGFFHRLIQADTFIVLDHVQFVHSNRGWTHRDKLLSANGPKWITIGIKKTSSRSPINTITMSDSTPWRTEHLNFIRHNYKSAEYFDEVFPLICSFYENATDSLFEFNMAVIRGIIDLLEIKVNLILSSELNPKGSKTNLILDLLETTNSKTYLSGLGAKDYLVHQNFSDAHINLLWQDFEHPIYTQCYPGFTPMLSVYDALLNCGPSQVSRMLKA